MRARFCTLHPLLQVRSRSERSALRALRLGFVRIGVGRRRIIGAGPGMQFCLLSETGSGAFARRRRGVCCLFLLCLVETTAHQEVCCHMAACAPCWFSIPKWFCRFGRDGNSSRACCEPTRALVCRPPGVMEKEGAGLGAPPVLLTRLSMRRDAARSGGGETVRRRRPTPRPPGWHKRRRGATPVTRLPLS